MSERGGEGARYAKQAIDIIIQQIKAAENQQNLRKQPERDQKLLHAEKDGGEPNHTTQKEKNWAEKMWGEKKKLG
jgi:hypothetical protein